MGGELWELWDTEMGYSHTSLLHEETQDQPDHDGAEPLWGVYQVRPDRSTHLHIFPHTTFEWRAAEYGVDPDDVDTLIDIVLHEPFIPSMHDPLVWENEAVARVVRETRNLPTCWTPGVSDETRLQAHLERIASVKRHRVQMVAAPQVERQAALKFVGSDRVAEKDPLSPIRAMRLDPVRVQGRRMAVAQRRAAAGFGRPSFTVKPPSTFVGMHPVRA